MSRPEGDRRRSGVQYPAPRLALDTPVGYLKGVGPVRAAALARLGINFAGDLLMHVPHRYEDASTITPIVRVNVGDDVTVLGRVIAKGVLPTRKGLRVFQCVVQDSSGLLEIAWPGQPFLERSINKDDWLLCTGPVRFYHGRRMQPREYVNLGPDEEGTAGGRVLAVYPATEGVSARLLRSLILQYLDRLLPLVRETLSKEMLAAGGVMPLPKALEQLHRPASVAEAMQGLARLAWEELLCVQLLHRRANQLARETRPGTPLVNQKRLTRQMREVLPFKLTGAQARALREIFEDMTSTHRMHRLLQGDVGSGKTVVALFAALLAMENGYQAAFMAPTELLAEQHVGSLGRMLEPLGIRPLLLTGRQKGSERREVLKQLLLPEPVLVIGTHALMQESVNFSNLGLVIVDEQHRFGVEQRASLGAKGQAPDVLLMSATPIPRSLALTLYGDLDVTVLDERPPGRQPITTVLRPETGRARVMEFLKSQLAEGRQGYVVYPVIEESEKTDLKAAATMFDALAKGPLSAFRLALLHGRLPSAERDETMRAFRDGKIDVLVATTVIEVGIDVPNATVMLVEHPERFGLSQLHQLRGRVGRGAEQSYCVLLGDVGLESAERLNTFVSTEDGFEIARADLELRGMGDLFGAKQHGMPGFRYADVLRDETLNEKARVEAERLLATDALLVQPAHAGLRRVLETRYARALELFRVG